MNLTDSGSYSDLNARQSIPNDVPLGEGVNTDKETNMLANRSSVVKGLLIVSAVIGSIAVLAAASMAAMCGGMMGMM